jgi:1,4-alpha-glucan branching enzyme
VENGPGGGVHFTLAGHGPLLPALQRTVVEMGLEHHVTFAGVLSKEQVRDLICNSDAAILLSAHEGSPIPVKEVLACGKPVIVNDVGDLAEYGVVNAMIAKQIFSFGTQ